RAYGAGVVFGSLITSVCTRRWASGSQPTGIVGAHPPRVIRPVGRTSRPVLTERDILEAWQAGKTGRQFYRLTSEMLVAFEYRGAQFGHPSNFAAIKLVATPSNDFSLDSAAIYPASVSLPYAKQLLLAVG